MQTIPSFLNLLSRGRPRVYEQYWLDPDWTPFVPLGSPQGVTLLSHQIWLLRQ